MKTNIIALTYKGFRFPPEIISHAVWLYFRFSLSFRDVEELLAQRGIVVTSETVRQWCLKFGQTYANELRRRRPRCGDKWHLDARLSQNQWRNPLPLASCRPGWECARYPGSEPTQQASSEAIFPQASQRATIRPARDQYR
jgi:hypothetical protein